jgi:polycystin 1L2
MRQLRIKSSLCSSRKVRLNCLTDYNSLNEEKHSFEPGWTNEITNKYSSSIFQAFEYQSSEELDTYVTVGDHGSYSGNGYVYEFPGRLNNIRNNLSQLYQLEWIDNYTRAVIIQLSLYNPNVQLFTSLSI